MSVYRPHQLMSRVPLSYWRPDEEEKASDQKIIADRNMLQCSTFVQRRPSAFLISVR